MSFGLESFSQGFGTLVSQVNDFKAKIEKQMDEALEDEEENFPPPEQVHENIKNVDKINNRVGKESRSGFGFDSFLGQSSGFLAKAVSGWGETEDLSDLEMTSDDEGDETEISNKSNMQKMKSKIVNEVHPVSTEFPVKKILTDENIPSDAAAYNEDYINLTLFLILSKTEFKNPFPVQRETEKGEIILPSPETATEKKAQENIALDDLLDFTVTNNIEAEMVIETASDPLPKEVDLALVAKSDREVDSISLSEVKEEKDISYQESESRIKELEFHLSQREKQLEKQAQIMSEMESKLERFESSNKQLKREKVLAEKYVVKSKDFQALQRKLEQTEDERRENESKSEALLKEGIELAQQKGDLEARLKEIRKENLALKRSNETLEAKLGDVVGKEKQMKTKCDTLTSDVESIKKENKKIRETFSEKEAKQEDILRSVRIQLKEQVEFVKIKKESHQRLENEFKALKSQSEAEILEAKKSADMYSKEIKMLKKRIVSLEKNKALVTGNLKSNDIQTSGSSIELLKEIELLKQKNDEILLRNQEQNASLLNSGSQKEEEINSLNSELNDLKTKQKLVEIEKESLEEFISSQKATNLQLKKTLEEKEISSENLKSRIEMLESGNRDLLETFNQREAEHERVLVETRHTLMQEISRLQLTITERQKELELVQARSRGRSGSSSLRRRRTSMSNSSFNRGIESESEEESFEEQPMTHSQILHSLNIGNMSSSRKYIPASTITQPSPGESPISGAFVRVKSLEADLRQKNGEVDSLRQQIKALESSRDRLLQDVEESQKSLTELVDLKEEMRNVKKQMEQKNELIEDLNIQIHESKIAFSEQIDMLANQLSLERN